MLLQGELGSLGAAVGAPHFKFIQYTWPELGVEYFHINNLELLAILFAIAGFAPLLKGLFFTVYSDSTSALGWANKPSKTKAKWEITSVLERVKSHFGIKAVVKHIKGTDNTVSDFLSRNFFHPKKRFIMVED